MITNIFWLYFLIYFKNYYFVNSETFIISKRNLTITTKLLLINLFVYECSPNKACVKMITFLFFMAVRLLLDFKSTVCLFLRIKLKQFGYKICYNKILYLIKISNVVL